jgi:uncharacterized membrane protein HdeD (DUF308 family)
VSVRDGCVPSVDGRNFSPGRRIPVSLFSHHRTDRHHRTGHDGNGTGPPPREPASAGAQPESAAGAGTTAQAGAAGAGGPFAGPGAGRRPGGLLSLPGSAGWQVVLTAGIAALALGVFVLAWPKATLLVVGVLFGVYLLASGVLQLAAAFSSHVPGHLRTLGFVSGTLCVLLGLICFRSAAESVLLLALWIGFGWLLRGGMLMAVALSGQDLPARGWQLLLGLVTFLGGVVLVVSPFGSLAALTVVAGIWLLALGVTEVAHAVRLRSRLRAAQGR